MSLTKSTTARHRLSLLAGSSLAVAGMIGAAGVLLTPPSAMAAPNPCGETPSQDGVINCPQGTYPTGIEHTSDGDLQVTVHPLSDFGTGGVVTTAGDLPDNLTVRMAGTATSSNTDINTSAPIVLDVESQQGDIVVDIAVARANSSFAGLRANGATTTHLIHAVAQQGGDVTVIRSLGNGTLEAVGVTGIAAIEARSIGGGNVTVGSSVASSQSASGRQYGIIASVDGDGLLTIDDWFGLAQGANGIAGIHASSDGGGDIVIGQSGIGNGRLYGLVVEANGSGDVTVLGSGSATTSAGLVGTWVTAGTGTVTIEGGGSAGAGGTGLLVETQGDVTINGSGNGGQYGIDMNTVAGTTRILNVAGSATGGLAALRVHGDGEAQITATGSIFGGLDFEDLVGGGAVDVLDGGGWFISGEASTVLGTDSNVSLAEGAFFVANGGPRSSGGSGLGKGHPTQVEHIALEFIGSGEHTITNAGTMLIGPLFAGDIDDNEPRSGLEAEFLIEGLDTFDNSGAILFGELDSEETMLTDGYADDILLMPGATFTGSGDSLLIMDVNLNNTQTACDPALRAPQDPTDTDLYPRNFDMPAADCMRLEGGATAGVTRVKLVDLAAGDRGGYSPEGIVIVDVTGGTGATGDFVVDPGSTNYSPAFGGVVDKGVFFYPIVWDADTQQHKIVSVPGGPALQYPVLAQAAHGMWRTATGTWLDRQADLRGGIDDGIGGGVWIRGSTETADRDLIQSVDAAGNAYTFDNTYSQSSYAVTIGTDVISGGVGEAAYVLGVMGGYTHSDVDFDTAPDEARFDGWHLGGYASVISGGFFLDAAVNGNKLIMDHDVPSLGLLPVGTITSTELTSIGGQLEAGWRIPFMGGAFVEPLAGVTYVRSKFEDLAVTPDDASRPGVDVEFDDPASLRASIGGRVGLDQDYGAWRAQLSLLGRVWNEFEDSTDVVLHSTGDDLIVSNEFTGQFTEVGLGASLYGMDGAVSGFVNVGGMFGDDFQSTKASAGIRVHW